jgi:uncharacterized membrane protein YedE/YeeE
MTFDNFFAAQSFWLWTIFGIALVLGAVVNKTNFCTMGAVSDMVNMGDYGRFRAWLLAIAVALTGVVVLEYTGLAQPGNAFPPYRAGQLIWAENLLGGLMFGVGMTLASGCGNKCLVRIGGGNIKSVMVMLIIAVIAYYMINPFPGSDQTLFTVLFYDWIRPLAVNLGARRLEVACVQFHGWATLNKGALMPTLAQAVAARDTVAAARMSVGDLGLHVHSAVHRASPTDGDVAIRAGMQAHATGRKADALDLHSPIRDVAGKPRRGVPTPAAKVLIAKHLVHFGTQQHLGYRRR